MDICSTAALFFICSAVPAGGTVQCSPIHSWYGVNPGGEFGWSLSGAGDVNGDGFHDVVVGAPLQTAGGSAFLLSGATGEAIYEWNGDSSGDRFGHSVAGGGTGDVIIGAPRNSIMDNHSGSAFVFSGQTGLIVHLWHGDSPNDEFGTSVDNAGDWNGDGVDDFIVGAPFDDVGGSDSGSAFVFSGSTGALLCSLHGKAAGQQFAWSVSSAGDVNGDGFDDVLIGAPYADINGNDSGSVFLFSGPNGELLHSWNGDSSGDLFGYSIGAAGDVDADGFDDVIVGAWGNDSNGTDSGSAFVFSGADGELLYDWHGNSAGDNFGFSVDGAGYADGDDHNDLVVGARFEDTEGDNSTGSASLFSGASGELIHTWYGINPSDSLGHSVAGAGDVNGDGFDDLVAGGDNDPDGEEVGSADAFTLSNCSCLEDIEGNDGAINAADLLSLLASWGPCNGCAADISGDGYVTSTDLLMLLAVWGPCP